MTTATPKERKSARSAFDIIFRSKDSDDSNGRLALATGIGANAGVGVSFGAVLLRTDVTFKELLLERKIWTVTQVAKGYAIGAISGFLYMWTVQKTSEARNGKDDWVNHFVGAFTAAVPYAAIYKRSMRYFVIAGTVGGLAASVVKYGAQREFIQARYMHADREVPNFTRYPELYINYQIRKDRRDDKRRLKELSESS